jgi:hypothetical protein
LDLSDASGRVALFSLNITRKRDKLKRKEYEDDFINIIIRDMINIDSLHSPTAYIHYTWLESSAAGPK